MNGDPTGLVLAGGASSRMGRPKPMVELAGYSLLQRSLAAVEAAGLSPAVVAKPDSELPPVGFPVFREPQEPRHPLLGIVSAISGRLDEEIAGPAVVVACDMPFVPPSLLAWLAEQPEPLIVCEGGGRLHPLLGRYSPGLEGELDAAIDAGTSAQETVRSLGARVVTEAALSNFGPPARVLFNVNDAIDLAQAERMADE